jgi:hypothetical protein
MPVSFAPHAPCCRKSSALYRSLTVPTIGSGVEDGVVLLISGCISIDSLVDAMRPVRSGVADNVESW